jgi:NhaP-type Na+/H+ or K+/H+ antiporter
MGTLGQLAVFFVFVSLAISWLLIFSLLSALVAKIRDVDVPLGAMYGAVLGPIGFIAVIALPKRLMTPSMASGRISRFSQTPILSDSEDPFF